MVTNYSDNNYLVLVGKITSEKRFSHEIYGESFYIFNLEVPRLSGNEDIIPITVSERLLNDLNLEIGKKVVVEGQFRSYNQVNDGKSKLVLSIFAKDFENTEDERVLTLNEATFIGYICKKPIYRKTPLGREIADLLLAVNRTYKKSDYIPCILWGRNAKYCEKAEVGDMIKLTGRIQSRNYEKKQEDGDVISKVAYEVSISRLSTKKKNNEN